MSRRLSRSETALRKRCRRIVNAARRNGTFPQRPGACEQCGSCVQGHHPDYHKPLDVQWLCRSCHGKVHRREKAALVLAAIYGRAQVNVRLTPAEKLDVQLVAAYDSATESDTLRNHTLTEIRRRAEKIRNMRIT